MSSAEFAPGDPFDSQTGPLFDMEKLEVFLNDYENFKYLNDMVFKGLVLPKQPEGTTHLFNCDKNVFSILFNQYAALKKIGYCLYLSDDPIRINNKMAYDGMLNLSVMTEDLNAIDQINIDFSSMSRSKLNQNLNMVQLIQGVDTRLYGGVLSSGNVNSRVADRELGWLPKDKRLPTLQRLFLTSLLFEAINSVHRQGDSLESESRPRYFNDGLLYRVLKSQGAEPFSPEEILGITLSTIKEIIANNPFIPKPFFKRS
jgi:hypothetical protein